MKPRHASAFTLIELLVVIGILALLVGLAVPALFGIRHGVRMGACQSNTGQLAMAVNEYAKDHNDLYPPWNPQKDPIKSLALAGEPGSSSVEGGNTPTDDRPINSYIGTDFSILECPLDRGCSDKGIDEPLFEATGSSYWYYTHTKGFRNQPDAYFGMERTFILAGQPMHRVISPTTKMVVADAVITRKLYSDIDGDPRDSWHSDDDPAQVSVGFADGSAGQRERKKAGSTSPQSVSESEIKNYMGDDEGYY